MPSSISCLCLNITRRANPGGPFNSFDISLTDSVNHRFFVSDRIGLDVAVFMTLQQDIAVNFFSGANGVAGGGVTASSCLTDNPASNLAGGHSVYSADCYRVWQLDPLRLPHA